MTDYQANSKRSKEALAAQEGPKEPREKLERIVTGEVLIKKQGILRKVKDIYAARDLKQVARWVGTDVLMPAMRNMVWDAFSRGGERVIYGNNVSQYRSGIGPRMIYNSPINRMQDPRTLASPLGYRPQETRPPRPEARSIRHLDDYILPTRQEATGVLDVLTSSVDKFGIATVGDLHELIGIIPSHTDQKYGWIDLSDARIAEVREGYLLMLPAAEPLTEMR